MKIRRKLYRNQLMKRTRILLFIIAVVFGVLGALLLGIMYVEILSKASDTGIENFHMTVQMLWTTGIGTISLMVSLICTVITTRGK